MLSPSERVRLIKEMRKLPEGDLLVKWETVSQWLSQFEDSDRWAIVTIDGDRYPCVTIGFILECVWRSDWVAFDEVDGRERLLAGFKDIPEPLPTVGSPTNYWRGAWIFEAQPRNNRRKTLKKRRTVRGAIRQDEPAVRLDPSLPVGQCNSQQLIEALMLQSGRWNNFDPEPILADLY